MSPGHLRASTPEIMATTPDGTMNYDNKVMQPVTSKLFVQENFKLHLHAKSYPDESISVREYFDICKLLNTHY